MMSRGLKAVRNLVCFLLFLTTPLFSSHAAQFAAELTVTSPQANFVYDLKVKDDLMRLQKIAGPMTVPPFPTIYNRKTGVTRGLMDQMRQYVEETDPVKTMVMNPVVGWEFMRKDMTGTTAAMPAMSSSTANPAKMLSPTGCGHPRPCPSLSGRCPTRPTATRPWP